MEKKVSETNKIKIFNLAVEGMEKKCEKKKKRKWKIATLKNVFFEQEVEL